MTYTEQAIRIAREQGYPEEKRCNAFDMYESESSYCYYATLLDPLFWQALGKGLGLYEYAVCNHTYPPNGDGTYSKICNKCNEEYSNFLSQTWQELWHRFIEHLAEGKTIEDYFKQLLTK